MRVTGWRISATMPSHVGRSSQGGQAQEGLERAEPLPALGRLVGGHRGDRGGEPSYVPSEGNTALLAEALRVPVGSLLTERDRLVERLPH
jgi:hypothetical protein